MTSEKITLTTSCQKMLPSKEWQAVALESSAITDPTNHQPTTRYKKPPYSQVDSEIPSPPPPSPKNQLPHKQPPFTGETQ